MQFECFMGKCITDVHWFVVVQCYTWRFMSLHFVHHLLLQWFITSNLVWLSARSGCCFPSYLHLTLTVFHQLIIPLRYLTIKFGISLFSPYSASFAPSPPRSISSSIPIWWYSSIIIICLRAIFWLLWYHHGRFGCFAVAVFTFQLSVRVTCLWSRQYSILDWFIRPLTFILQFHRACWRSTLLSLIFKSFHLLSVSKPRAAISLFDRRCSLRIYLSFPYSVISLSPTSGCFWLFFSFILFGRCSFHFLSLVWFSPCKFVAWFSLRHLLYPMNWFQVIFNV